MLIRLIAQSHLDPIFMWNWDEGLASAISTSRSAVNLLQKYKDLIFSRSDALLHLWIKQTDPKLFEQIKELVKQGRWIPVGGWYLQADGGIPSGESFIRQALIGQEIFRELFGNETNLANNIAWMPDNSSPPATFPKILAHCEFEYYVFSRPRDNQLKLPAPLIWWRSDDGSEILAYKIPVGYSTYADEAERIEQIIQLCPDWLDQMMCFFGLGNHGGGPTEKQIIRVLEFAKQNEDIDIAFSSPLRFFEDVKNNPEIPFYRGGLEPFVIGTYALNYKYKNLHDRAQRQLLLSEKFSTIAEILDISEYDIKKFNEIWQDLLFCQFHDLIPSTSVKSGLEHAEQLLSGVLANAERTKVFTLRKIANEIDTSASAYVRFIVFNDTAIDENLYFEYEPWLIWQNWENYKLLDENDLPVPHQQTQSAPAAPGHTRIIIKTQIPANGYKLLRVVGPEPDLGKIGPGYTKSFSLNPELAPSELNTPIYKIGLSNDKKSINTITHKQSSATLPISPEIQILEDKTDTFSYYEFGYDKIIGNFEFEPFTIIEAGPIRWTLERKGYWQNSKVRQEIRIFDESEIIEIHNWLDWHEEFQMAKLNIKMPFEKSRLTAGIAFGQIERYENNHEFLYHNWLLARPNSNDNFENNSENQLQSLAILVCSGMHAGDFIDNTLRLSLVRSPVYCHEELNGQRYTPGPRHEHIGFGQHHFIIGLLPVIDTEISPAKLINLSYTLDSSVSIITDTEHKGTLPPSGKFVDIKPKSVMISAIKKAQDETGYIIRLIETAGIETSGIIHWHKCDIHFNISPFAILSLKLIPIGNNQWKSEIVTGLENKTLENKTNNR